LETPGFFPGLFLKDVHESVILDKEEHSNSSIFLLPFLPARDSAGKALHQQSTASRSRSPLSCDSASASLP
jgi:hypothetical protein